MSRWFRFYDDAINDPKILKLPEAMRWHWTAFLCIASKHDGVIPPLDDVAILLRVTTSKAMEIITGLVKAGLLDKTETGFAPHNWTGRQYKSDVSTDRVKRFRNGKRNDDETFQKRPQIQITDTDTEKKESRAIALVDWPSDFREQFWNLYPHKIGKADAIAKLERTRKRDVSWVALMDGLRRYIASKPADRPWCNPATWLNQARWEDQPAGSVVQAVDEAKIDWDDQVQRLKRGFSWSKWCGPEPGMAGCRVPADILAKHGYLNEAQDVPPIRINSMQ